MFRFGLEYLNKKSISGNNFINFSKFTYMTMLSLVKNDPWLKPFSEIISKRNKAISEKIQNLNLSGKLQDFATGHLYFGIHKNSNEWEIREWAPNAQKIYLIGNFNNWKESDEYSFSRKGAENWELILSENKLNHLDQYKLRIYFDGGTNDRIPPWANYVVQDQVTKNFNACVWQPQEAYQWKNNHKNYTSEFPLIYEAHVGMATEDYTTGTFNEFREKILPRIKKAGYNTVQLMAIQEHPYYGSFGYHVSSLFAPSSRFGTPYDLKKLVDEAHSMGIAVIMDLVHSHAVKNKLEGLGDFDGTPYQFFHTGARREHVAWDSLCFNYGKDQVIHFLLSNIQYWMGEFQFDGFRFDGVTSMLYLDHGLSRDFTGYEMYFDRGQDEDAITYLGLANELIRQINPNAISVAEEMSGYPGLATPLKEGGLGFTHRMAMGTPDYWIKIIKDKKDEEWNIEEMYYELTRKRIDEQTVGYSESHDQALVGDKTIIFRLIDKEMYTSMDKESQSVVVDRGIALHKMIRLITSATSGNSYLNFMGNEFGHPEWIDFPREGNNWSFQYARRQWSLMDNPDLKYHYLGDFDRDMINLIKEFHLLSHPHVQLRHANPVDMVLGFERGNLYFAFNFHPEKSYTGYGLSAIPGNYKIHLSTDSRTYGGQERIDPNLNYRTFPERSYTPNQMLKIYLPSRTAVVMERTKIKTVNNLLIKD